MEKQSENRRAKTTKEQDQMIEQLFIDMKDAIREYGMRLEQQRSQRGKDVVFSNTVGDFRLEALKIAKAKIISKEWTPEMASAFTQKF